MATVTAPAASATGDDRRRAASTRLVAAALLGVGFGGLIDGILFHRVLRWHNFVSDVPRYAERRTADLDANLLADGLFDLFTVAFLVVGVVLLVRTSPAPAEPRLPLRFAGGLLIGWGAFNLADGVVAHLVLSLHRLRDDVAQPLPWDLAYLGFGLVLLVVGAALVARSRPPRSVSA